MDSCVSFDPYTYITGYPRQSESLFKWRLRLDGIESNYRFNYWIFKTTPVLTEGNHYLLRNPGIFELFIQQSMSVDTDHQIEIDISLLFHIIIILMNLKLIEPFVMNLVSIRKNVKIFDIER